MLGMFGILRRRCSIISQNIWSIFATSDADSFTDSDGNVFLHR